MSGCEASFRSKSIHHSHLNKCKLGGHKATKRAQRQISFDRPLVKRILCCLRVSNSARVLHYLIELAHPRRSDPLISSLSLQGTSEQASKKRFCLAALLQLHSSLSVATARAITGQPCTLILSTLSHQLHLTTAVAFLDRPHFELERRPNRHSIFCWCCCVSLYSPVRRDIYPRSLTRYISIVKFESARWGSKVA